MSQTQINVPFDGLFRKLDIKGNIQGTTLDTDGKLSYDAAHLGCVPRNYGYTYYNTTLVLGNNTISFAYLNPPYIWSIYAFQVILSAAVATNMFAYTYNYLSQTVSQTWGYAGAGTAGMSMNASLLRIIIPPLYRMAYYITGAAGGETAYVYSYHRYDLPNVELII